MPGAKGTKAALAPVSAGSASFTVATTSQNRDEPDVSITRWTRVALLAFTTRWRRQESKIQHSPAAMWMRSWPQWNTTDWFVITGM